MSAERKGQDKFEFSVAQKFIFATNQVPESEHDPELADRLKEESPAILNWRFDGLNRLLDQQKFSNEGTVDDTREIADAFGSVLDRFAHVFLDVTGEPEDLIHPVTLPRILTFHEGQNSI